MEATPAARTVWPPCVVAFLWTGFLIFGEIVVALLGNLSDTAPPREGWIYPAVIGHCVLAGLVSSLS